LLALLGAHHILHVSRVRVKDVYHSAPQFGHRTGSNRAGNDIFSLCGAKFERIDTLNNNTNNKINNAVQDASLRNVY